MHTYTSIYLHVVFATWDRRRFLAEDVRPRAHAHLAATARNLGLADVDVGGHDDHVHLLGRFDPASAISSIVGQLKQSTTHWLRLQIVPSFQWQRGFSAFSVSLSRVRAVRRYVQRQEEHHRHRDFRAELEDLLRECGVAIKDAHLL